MVDCKLLDFALSKVAPEIQCVSSGNGVFTLFTYGYSLNIV
jgi:hypothetical protein